MPFIPFSQGFDPISYLMGKTAGGGGSGGIPIIDAEEWEYYSAWEKRQYGLVAIQDSDSGYVRGTLVNGADYTAVVTAEMTPIHSYNISDNNMHTYNFVSTTLSGASTEYCMYAMMANGTDPQFRVSTNFLGPNMKGGNDGNGAYSFSLAPYMDNTYASVYSTGDNWNNASMVCFGFSSNILPGSIERFYEQGKTGTYTYSYQAQDKEDLMLIVMRGGSVTGDYTITGLTRRSHDTATGGRFNDVYYDRVEEGDTVSISIPYEAGENNNGALFVALITFLSP